VVAAQNLARHHGIGLFYRSIEELGAMLRDSARMAQLREQVWQQRFEFCFDTHVPALQAFFRTVVERASRGARTAG
jgi:hypothetical protein